MSRKWTFVSIPVTLFVIMMLVAVGSAFAQGPIIATPFPPQPPLQPITGQAYLQSHKVTVTVQDQIAVTKIEQVFVNEGSRPAEGTYLFPLPVGAAVSNLTMLINGVAIQAQILDAQQAQQIYTNTVRQLRDPALLQYVGRSAIQANVFPIPAGQTRTIQITYSQILTADNGLINYTYALKTDYVTKLPAQTVSLSIDVSSKDPISTIYSPNPLVAISRTDDSHFSAGFETTNYRPSDDFSLYYGTASSTISANLLTYRNSANEDGFFMLMLTPPTKVNADQIIPKDVFVVLDQSGSMNDDDKWNQARQAAGYILKKLNPNDRFNALLFSTGYRIYANTLQSPSEADKAVSWINSQSAEGGTDINAALTTVEGQVDKERQTVVLFLTDGQPTEGVTNVKDILSNVAQNATPNLRIFSFGVGNDVDTFLLDSLSTTYHGTSVYVRPGENIEDKVSSLYNKITSPVMTSLKLDFGSVTVDDLYPAAPLPDLFAGTQLVVVGRFRDQGTTSIKLTGLLNGSQQTFSYDNLNFPANAGGQAFIPRLWATRKIGTLLNQIRLNGENPELVKSVISLSIRYGIITPYTSYLIQESDINAQGGDKQPKPITQPTIMPMMSNQPSSGASAVGAASKSNDAANADQAGGANSLVTAAPSPTAGAGQSAATASAQLQTGTANTNDPIQQVNDRTFVLHNGIWTDTLYNSDQVKVVPVIFLSDDYFKLLSDHPEIKDYLAIGDHVIIMIGDTAYEIKPDGK